MKVINLTSRHQNQIDGEEWFYPPADKEGMIARGYLGGELSLAYSPSYIKVIGLVFDNINSDTIRQATATMIEYLEKTSCRYEFFRYHYVGYKTLKFSDNFKKRIFIFEIVAKK